MRITAELSLYPLEGDALAEVIRFIEDLSGDERVDVVVNQISTQVRGELDDVMDLLTAALKRSFGAGKQALVVKFLSLDLPIGEPPELSVPAAATEPGASAR